MENVAKKTEMIKVWLAVGLCIFGCLMVLAGFIVYPLGIIHNSVLIVVGEIFSFAGAVLGINMVYQRSLRKLESQIDMYKKEINDKYNGQIF